MIANFAKTGFVSSTYAYLVITYNRFHRIHFPFSPRSNSDPNDESIGVEWKPTTPENPYHLNFGNKLEGLEGMINHEQQLFWKQLKQKYYPKRDADN